MGRRRMRILPRHYFVGFCSLVAATTLASFRLLPSNTQLSTHEIGFFAPLDSVTARKGGSNAKGDRGKLKGQKSVEKYSEQKKEKRKVSRKIFQHFIFKPPERSKKDYKNIGLRFSSAGRDIYYHGGKNSGSGRKVRTLFPPRVVVIGQYNSDSSALVQHSGRKIKRNQTDLIESDPGGSVVLGDAQLRERRDGGDCVPMQEWQTTFHPTCNRIHEIGLGQIDQWEQGGDDAFLFGTKGYWRHAWKLDLTRGGHLGKKENRDTVVLKTLKLNHTFEAKLFEHARVDAVAMERLTSSPHVVDVFGFCAQSVLNEFADGKRVGLLADTAKKKPLARLKIVRDIALGLADVHGIDKEDGSNATFVHMDINPANVVTVGETGLKLNDFNIGILLKWNTTSNTRCGFPAQYPNPQWRSPEEAMNRTDLTEKIDVFSMGHIFFRMICGREPWNKLELGGRPSKQEINEKVKKGILPTIPESVMNTDDKEVIAIRDAMLQCYTFDPEQRPSAREIAKFLNKALKKLEKSSQ